MDIFSVEGPLQDIISYATVTPKLERVSRMFQELSQLLRPRMMEYMNREYPTWNLDPQEIANDPNDTVPLAVFLITLMLLNNDTDAIKVVANIHSTDEWYLKCILTVLFQNRRDDLALQIARSYYLVLINSPLEDDIVMYYLYLVLKEKGISTDDIIDIKIERLNQYYIDSMGTMSAGMRLDIANHVRLHHIELSSSLQDYLTYLPLNDIFYNEQLSIWQLKNPEGRYFEYLDQTDSKYLLNHNIMFDGSISNIHTYMSLLEEDEKLIRYSASILLYLHPERWDEDLENLDISDRNIYASIRIAVAMAKGIPSDQIELMLFP